MPRAAAPARSGSDRTGLYQEITSKIIAELKAGRLPWVQPWGASAVQAPLAIPKNASTRRRYSGVNVLILWGAVVQRGFSGQSWLTFRQALGIGGHIRKGEHGTTVVFADRFIPDRERVRARERGDEPNAIPFLKRFTVFNTDQCDDLPPEVTTSAPPPPEGVTLPEVEALIRASGADVRIGGERAYYDVGGDFVRVPPRKPISSRSTGTGRLCTSLVIMPSAGLCLTAVEIGSLCQWKWVLARHNSAGNRPEHHGDVAGSRAARRPASTANRKAS